jgi:Arc/MetJ-type ribon-helix-helix transcriptional regulator
VKVSVSLHEDDVEFLDQYAAEHGIASRSAVLQRAVRLLRTTGLGAAYEDAWTEWERDGDAALWASTDADGLA